MADPEKVRVIKKLSPPATVKEVRTFNGMCSFYKRLVPYFSEVAKTLIKLTKKFTKFEWTNECQPAFE